MVLRKQLIIYCIEYLVIIILSLIASYLSVININNNSITYFDIFKRGIYQYILLIFNILVVFLFIFINERSIDRIIKKNSTSSIMIYIFLILHLLIIIDCFIIKSLLMALYGLLYFPYIPLIIVSLILASGFHMSEWILTFPIILINNVIFSIIIKKISYKNDSINKYIVSALFYLQNNNSLPVFLLLRLIFH